MSYKLYYWPIPFRGNLIRFLLAGAGVEFEEASVQELLAIKNDPETPKKHHIIAPPFLRVTENGEDKILSQSGTIVMYLAERHGLLPSDPWKRMQCSKAMGDATDILAGMTRSNGAQMWDSEAWQAYSSGRLTAWMDVAESTGVSAGLGADTGYYLGTAQPTVADYIQLAVWKTMENGLPELSPTLRSRMPFTMALCDRLLAPNAKLKQYMESQKSHYCGGQIERSLKEVIAATASHTAKKQKHAE
jgi:glutathione S-transferase